MRGIRRTDLPLSTRSDSHPVFWNATLENRERACVRLTFSRLKLSRLTVPSTSAAAVASAWTPSARCSSSFCLQVKRNSRYRHRIGNCTKQQQRALIHAAAATNLFRLRECRKSTCPEGSDANRLLKFLPRLYKLPLRTYILSATVLRQSYRERAHWGSNLQTDLYFLSIFYILPRSIHWLY